jgi:hypothetical protein
MYAAMLNTSAVVPLYAEDAARRLDKTSLAAAGSDEPRESQRQPIASVCIIRA